MKKSWDRWRTRHSSWITRWNTVLMKWLSSLKVILAYLMSRYISSSYFMTGKTLHSFIPHYKGCCHRYDHRFLVPLSGVYHLKIVRLRSCYLALNESYLDYPVMKKEYLLNEWVELNGSRRDVDRGKERDVNVSSIRLNSLCSHFEREFGLGYWILRELYDPITRTYLNSSTGSPWLN